MRYLYTLECIILIVHDATIQNGETALHIACKKGSHEVENVLIAEGADQAIINKVTKALTI